MASTGKDSHNALRKATINTDPISQFSKWMEDALLADLVEPTAMCLSTVSKEGKPSSRIVLLKGIHNTSFLFYTNYQSRKAEELEETTFAALNFYWAELHRQVRIEGQVHRLDHEISSKYFETRPRSSQISAWASPQSKPVRDRKVLEERKIAYELKFVDKEVTKPPYWGGYGVKAHQIEFWQGREARLHDRLRFTIEQNETWTIERLAP